MGKKGTFFKRGSPMKTIMHISDLHFGKVDAVVRDALAKEIRATPPDVLAVSGDLTQRARVSQFQDFCAFISDFSVPKIIVPGNHDIPLFDVFRRFFSPLTRFRKIVEADLSPTYEDEEVFILGANTAHSWTVAGGKFSAAAIERVRERLCQVPPHKLRILVCHHPLHISAEDREGWVGGLDQIRERIDVVLTGHLHQSENEVVVLRKAKGDGTEAMNESAEAKCVGAEAKIAGADLKTADTEASSALLVRAGTAISIRHRGETNSFNLLRVFPESVEVELRCWDSGSGAFQSNNVRRFQRDPRTYPETQISLAVSDFKKNEPSSPPQTLSPPRSDYDSRKAGGSS
jgi:3',5'-cyclic AMP phosphodiesterase CpdA